MSTRVLKQNQIFNFEFDIQDIKYIQGRVDYYKGQSRIDNKHYALKYIQVDQNQDIIRELDLIKEIKGLDNVQQIKQIYYWKQYDKDLEQDCIIIKTDFIEQTLENNILKFTKEEINEQSNTQMIIQQLGQVIKGLYEWDNQGLGEKYYLQLKPENILEDKNQKIQIADYGIDYLQYLEQKNEIKILHNYMSPEQRIKKINKNIGAVDFVSSNIFSLGLILLKALKNLNNGDLENWNLYEKQQEVKDEINEFEKNKDLKEILDKMLQFDQKTRNCSELVEFIERTTKSMVQNKDKNKLEKSKSKVTRDKYTDFEINNFLIELFQDYSKNNNKQTKVIDIDPKNILSDIQICSQNIKKEQYELQLNNKFNQRLTRYEIKNDLVQGNVYYMSPELLQKFVGNEEGAFQPEENNIFSLGLTYLRKALVLNEKEIAGMNDQVKGQNKIQQQLNKIEHQGLKLIISSMLELDTKERPNLDELEYFNKNFEDMQEIVVQQISANKQIDKRIQEQKNHSLKEIVHLIKDSINSLQKSNKKLKNQDKYFNDLITTNNIKKIKQIDAQLEKLPFISPELEQQVQDVYHRHLDKINMEKSNIFSIGMLILKTKLMLNNQQIIGKDQKQPREKQIQSLLDQIDETDENDAQLKYLICQMLNFNVNERFDLQQILEQLKKIKTNITLSTNKILQLEIFKDKQSIEELQLDLGNQHLQGIELQQVNENLLKMINLQELNLILKQNQIDEKGCQTLFQVLSNLTTLLTININIRENSIGANGCQFISQFAEHSTNLEKLWLNLGHNDIKDKGCEYLADHLITLTNLQDFSLGLFNNQIGEEGAQHISKLLQSFVNLHSLYLLLNKNNIGENGCHQISGGLSHLHQLEKLILMLQSNNIKEHGCQYISKALAHQKKLKELQLNVQHNTLFDKSAQLLIDSVLEIKALAFIKLELRQDNDLSSEINKQIQKKLKLHIKHGIYYHEKQGQGHIEW